MRKSVIRSAALLLAICPVAAHADYNLSTAVGSNTLGPQFIITFAANGGVSTVLNPVYGGSDPGPYATEDAYFGVVNNTSHAIGAFNLAGSGIGGFDQDGINLYADFGYGRGVYNPYDKDPSLGGYGGHDAFFTNNLGDTLTVNFAGGISANGGTDVFSLEDSTTLATAPVVGPPIVAGVPEPSSWVMMLLGFAGLGFLGYRKTTRTSLAVS